MPRPTSNINQKMGEATPPNLLPMTEVYCKKFDVYEAREHESFSVIPDNPNETDDFGTPIKFMYVPYNGEFKLKRVYTGKEHFDENKKNLLFSLSHRRLTIAIKKSDEKVKIGRAHV